ncbi:MAG TPA: Ig-like domain-containing protein [Gallionella sp.]
MNFQKVINGTPGNFGVGLLAALSLLLAGCGGGATSAESDMTPPAVLSVTPATAATGVATNVSFMATFSEAVNPATVNASTFTVGGIIGTVAYSGTTATFTPSTPLANNTPYTATITTGVQDLAGNAMSSGYSWTFTTSAAPDMTPPAVLSVTPVTAATGVATNISVMATFSEAVNPATVNASTFTVGGITGTVTYSGTTAIFTPSTPLANNTPYTATITTGVQDLAGNAMSSGYSWTFTTSAAPDMTPPAVLSVTPVTAATGVATNISVTATFSEAVNPATVNASTFTVGGITGTVTYNGTTATFTPSTPLANNTPYTATITTGVQDLAGNAMSSGYSWTFTTSAAPDMTKIGPFTAEYYNGTVLVASESVARPSINYIYSNFNGIDSLNFHAIWTGNIEVLNQSKAIDINFDVNWSDVSLFIDGVNIASWSNNLHTVQHVFSPGVHEIKIEYYNHWHTTGFNVSFTTNTMYSKGESIGLISPLIDGNTRIIYVGSYGSADLYNNSTVTLNGTAASKVFLFLSSYSSQNWIINNPNNVTITGIVYSSNTTVSTVAVDQSVPTFEVAGLAYGYDGNFSAPSADINYLVGRTPDYTYGTYGLNQLTILIP